MWLRKYCNQSVYPVSSSILWPWSLIWLPTFYCYFYDFKIYFCFDQRVNHHLIQFNFIDSLNSSIYNVSRPVSPISVLVVLDVWQFILQIMLWCHAHIKCFRYCFPTSNILGARENCKSLHSKPVQDVKFTYSWDRAVPAWSAILPPSTLRTMLHCGNGPQSPTRYNASSQRY